ncbi:MULTISPECIES: caspase family protein [unclassified Bradyrhizobium]|uniref:caspase family protein n=1 Tax=unclassified Bradyrhizobium TaxID=2631580 RepID=UPI0028E7AFD9|nr:MULTISPECIES: caspase family protein [unclassified Bradyrhizobium]
MVALLIGNSAYPDGEDLKNPINDAADLGGKLKQYGFDVVVAKDRTYKEMDTDLKAFRKTLDSYEVALFFFAGHGIQIDGVNYLLAVDTDAETEDDAKFSSLSLDKVVDAMAKSQASTRIIILDACRSNPWERKWHRGPASRGLASVYAPKGTIIGFATSPGEVAYDGVGRNGTYTAALLQHIETPDCSIEVMFKRVRNTIAAASAGKQTSWEHTSLSGEFYFNLSLGALIDEYDGSALADGLFVINEAKKSHRIIAGLKSHNWYAQNPALRELDASTANRAFEENLFVIGRNIYQAACGSAAAAVEFVKNFMQQTNGFKRGKRKALLDGVLFEIFFDSKGKLRKDIKGNLFDEVFELQRFPELKASFDFIAEALVAAGGNFFTIPGKGHELAVTVSIKMKKGELRVDAIYVSGTNVLRDDDEPSLDTEGKRVHTTVKSSRLERLLSEDLIVPKRLLKVTYTQNVHDDALLHIPRGWTVRKA